VTAIERKKRAFEGIVRLRAAERGRPPNRDIAAALTIFEDDLGPTLSRRLAARLLGVDHKALERWVRSGDVPLVESVSGRLEVPSQSVVELYEAVRAEREQGDRSRHHLEPAMRSGRRRAERLRPERLVPSAVAHIDPHDTAALRSLAYHRAVAQNLTREMVSDAGKRVWRWQHEDRIAPEYAAAWTELLSLPLRAIRERISEDSEAARDLRQNSPFAGVLSEAERRRIYDEIG
jgi:hypothetical protein